MERSRVGGRSSSSSGLQRATWQERSHVLAHILTHPTTSPSLHSQLLVSSLVPCYLAWDYPPFLCGDPPPLLRWSLSLFLRRASTLGLPPTSWRSKCPFQQPPPLVPSPAAGTPPERWGAAERRAWVRARLRRGRLGVKVPAVVAVAVPNLMLLSMLLWDPLWLRRRQP